MTPWVCRLVGHRPRFRAEGRTLHWECERGCGHAGSKAYRTAEEARRYAAAFDRTGELGNRAPPIGLLPLRLWRKARRS
ncbi:hypothetical protein [Mycobacterium branderi]|uniref:Uncharacterized protein n=1 Tax=Mycobacterium branderi TaxID=43348 RepID=A0A7I7W6X7_9MYCO|nr:hypothetical protein [Mycobacterium branderi]MCV7231325.1 hypothetical protein [Mycobacterium branderi]ORA31690.1 hypothetical protein BST20_26540 [Mycobacterium branderi]BBZ12697.1 hypothetical protein MBRA_28920 [Mycobacterium branderi]